MPVVRCAVLCAQLVSLSLAGCKKDAEVHAAVPVDPHVVKQERLTFLVTGAENGYLLPTKGDSPTAPTRGGAAELLGRWVANDGHCAGPLTVDGSAPASCANAETVVVSTGDNANGQAISSYFKGESTAELMRHMGYAASALGNRELDWSREQFLKNTKSGGFPYLAANLQAADDEGKRLGLAPYRLITRKGVNIGLVGLSSHKATITPMPGRMAGITWVKEEQALNQVVPVVRAAGAQVIAVISDGCLEDLAPLFENHADWQVAFVAGRKCEAPFPETVGLTHFVYPGRHFNEYVKAVVTVDLAKPAGAQLVSVVTKNVEVVNEAAPPADATAQKLVTEWKAKLDTALGGTLGFTKTGLEQESPEMSAWLTTALREQFKTDVAVLNRKGVRQGLPAGPFTKATVYDLVPFDNQVVLIKLSGEQLLAALANVQARVAGVKPKGDGYVDSKGAPIDPKRSYSVATIDYLYLGGDGFALHQADPAPTQTNSSWQAALIEWTAAKKTDEKTPLESLVKLK